MAEQLTEVVRARDSAEVGLKMMERQFEEVHKELHYSEINLATEKQMVTELHEELRKAREFLLILEEFSAVAKDYCDISWGKALNVIGIPTDSSLRRPESIYYDPDIRELSGPGSSPSEQPTQVSEVPIANQVPLAPVEVPTDSRQDASKGKEFEAPQGKDMGKGKGKASDTTISQPEQATDPGAPKA